MTESVEGNVLRPAQRDASEARLQSLSLPDGFSIEVFAEARPGARMMAVDDAGRVYLTQPDSGAVLMLHDADSDGRADAMQTVVSGLDGVHGILLHDGHLYLAPPTKVYRAALNDDGTAGEPEVFLDNLPDGGQHPNRTLGVGPDGMLYVSVGSSCNACEEPNPEHATMLRASFETGEREVFAEGLRNTIGFGWHPETGALWGFDHGSDWRGDGLPPEEFNRIVEGGDYGWPYCYADRQIDPVESDPPGTTKEAYCQETEPAVLTYDAHAAPIAMAFYISGRFPADYHGDAFAAMRGSWNRNPAVGYEVVRVQFEHGEPTAIEPFVTGWLVEDGRAHFGRLAGVAVTPDGALLVSDDANGILYRIAYTGS